jgi:enoyl-[acyl-carrier-protein] reductase (NADH)
MFIGNDDLATYVKFENATPPKWVYTYLLPAFWAIHVLAITSTLLLVLEAFGKKLKQHVKLTFSLRKRIIICSVNKKSIAFAENALTKKDHKVSVVFLDDDVSKQDMETITKAGAYLINESPVNLKTVDVSSNSNDGINVKGFKQAGLNLCGKRSHLWWLRRKRNVEVFSFYEDEIMQYNLYKDIQQCANNIKYPTGKLSIFLHVEESLDEDQLDGLFKELNRKGSANEIRLYKVSTFSESQLSADILFSNHPLIEEKRRYFHKGLLDRDYMKRKNCFWSDSGLPGEVF